MITYYYNFDFRTRCSAQPCTHIAYISRRHPSGNVQKKKICDRTVGKQMVTLSDPLFEIENAGAFYGRVKR